MHLIVCENEGNPLNCNGQTASTFRQLIPSVFINEAGVAQSVQRWTVDGWQELVPTRSKIFFPHSVKTALGPTQPPIQ
jgi:hypothetical protein